MNTDGKMQKDELTALDKVLEVLAHSYEWGEMTLLEQSFIRDEAAAELARLRRVEAAAKEALKHLNSCRERDAIDQFNKIHAALAETES